MMGYISVFVCPFRATNFLFVRLPLDLFAERKLNFLYLLQHNVSLVYNFVIPNLSQ